MNNIILWQASSLFFSSSNILRAKRSVHLCLASYFNPEVIKTQQHYYTVISDSSLVSSQHCNLPRIRFCWSRSTIIKSRIAGDLEKTKSACEDETRISSGYVPSLVESATQMSLHKLPFTLFPWFPDWGQLTLASFHPLNRAFATSQFSTQSHTESKHRAKQRGMCGMMQQKRPLYLKARQKTAASEHWRQESQE